MAESTSTESRPAEAKPTAPVPVVMNDSAGKMRDATGPDELRRLAEANGVAIEAMPSANAEEMRKTLTRLRDEGRERVAVAGGDGTIHLAVQVLAGSDTALGIIPQGTANNFANALRIPQDLPSALRVLQDGVPRQVDLGFVVGEYFTESAGVGLFADALSLYGRANKNYWRALKAIVKIVFAMRASRVKLTVDGVTIAERAVMCTVANAYRMSYSLPMAPGAKVTDQELDVVVLGDLTRAELIPYFRAIRAQLHQSLPKVTTMKGRRIRIEAYRRMPVHCDDRVVCTTPVEIEVRPGILKVLVERL